MSNTDCLTEHGREQEPACIYNKEYQHMGAIDPSYKWGIQAALQLHGLFLQYNIILNWSVKQYTWND